MKSKQNIKLQQLDIVTALMLTYLSKYAENTGRAVVFYEYKPYFINRDSSAVTYKAIFDNSPPIDTIDIEKLDTLQEFINGEKNFDAIKIVQNTPNLIQIIQNQLNLTEIIQKEPNLSGINRKEPISTEKNRKESK